MEKPTWKTERKRLGDLAPWPNNPRTIEPEEARRLAESFEEFGQVETIAIGPDASIYNGHQRLTVLLAQHGSDYEVDVRVSSRSLTDKERQRLTVLLHEGAIGAWDWDLLASWDIDISDLEEWGLDEGSLAMLSADVMPIDYSDFDEELEDLEGCQEENIIVTVPVKHLGAITDWLANGESKTAPGIGKGVMKRCGLL